MIFKLIINPPYYSSIKRYCSAEDFKNNKWIAYLCCHEIEYLLSLPDIGISNAHEFIIYNKQYLELYNKYKNLKLFE